MVLIDLIFLFHIKSMCNKTFRADFILKWRLYLAASFASYSGLASGMTMVWSSPTIPHLKGSNSPLATPPTLDEATWIGSSLTLGAVFGPVIWIPLSKCVGRRWIIVSLNLPLLLGWLLIGLATVLPMIYVARILWGMLMGIQFAVVPVYLGEISEDWNRGALGALFLLYVATGMLISYAVGPYTTYWGLAITGGVVGLINVPCSILLPETPFYLVWKGRIEEASKVLQNLRGGSKESVQPELDGLQAAVARDFKEPMKIKDLWATRGNVKALGICACLCMLLELAGIDVILAYTGDLMEEVGTSLTSANAAIVMGVVQVVSTAICPLVVDRVGRKFLMWSTSLGLFIILCLVGVYTLLEKHFKMDVSQVTVIPILLLILYMILFSLGVGPVPWILIGEMFSSRTKDLASGICSFMCFFVGFLCTKFLLILGDKYGIYSTFFILSIFCLIGFVFSIALLPETKGKSFDEIQEILNTKKNPSTSAASGTQDAEIVMQGA